MRKIKRNLSLLSVALLFIMPLTGCSNINKLDNSFLISSDVKGDEVNNPLKIIAEKEYSIENNREYNNPYLFFRSDNNLYLSSYLYKNGMADENIIEGIKFDGDSAKFDEVYRRTGIGGYDVDLSSLSKIRIYNPITGEEFFLNGEKFKQSACYKENKYENYEFINGKIISLIIEDNSKENDMPRYKEIMWYDVTNDSYGEVDIPNEIILLSVSGITNDNLYYVAGDNPGQQFGSKIGVINMKDKTIEKPIEVGPIHDYRILDNDRVLLANVGENSTIIKIVNLKNKVSKEISTISNYFDTFIVPESNDRIFYEEIKDDKKQLIVAYFKDEEIQSKCTLYEYNKDNKISVAVSDDGKDVVIGNVKENEKQEWNINSIVRLKLNK